MGRAFKCERYVQGVRNEHVTTRLIEEGEEHYAEI